MHNSASAQKMISRKLHSERANRRPVTASLEGKSFERFIEELSSSFVRAPVDEIGDEIDRWIREIVLGLDLDRGALAQIDAKSGNLVVRHSWSRDQLVKLPIGLGFTQSAPWFNSTLMSGRTVAFSKVSELPPEFFESDWKTYRRYVPKSNVTVAVRIGGEVVGALGFGTVKKERTWSPRLIHRLELVGEIFGNALERRLATEEIILLRNELSHMSRTTVMGELTASLTHQLNQPIGAILMNAEEMQKMLESGQPDLESLRAVVGDIIQDDLRATETIKGLRSFFRKSEVEKTPLYLRDVVAEVMRIVRGDALFRNVSLAFEAPPSRGRVAGDRIQLQQAILNLVLNAFDAVSEKDGLREVSISIGVDKDEAKIAVRDSGNGVDPAMIAHIFEPFFTTKSKGMGMGLAIVRSIIKAHGGQVSARRNPDRGSTFEITLPALQEKI
ncbi:GAF domain-containing sensor histidine kinase [Candidatus Binatus sp.]|uniref:GAF domain-containing sensor histidine kinase n=1 Tax=Candidatus Binatus sp. TaxID=2811406 RepID=UPI003CAEDE2F